MHACTRQRVQALSDLGKGASAIDKLLASIDYQELNFDQVGPAQAAPQTRDRARACSRWPTQARTHAAARTHALTQTRTRTRGRRSSSTSC
jgi:hypothetical protein